MLLAVRHGKTHMNEDGTEKLRGWLPISLTTDGMEEADETAKLLHAVEDVHKVYTSPLVRAVQSAAPIGHILGVELEPVDWLMDWNTGHTGEEVKKTLPIIHDMIDNPDKKSKGGESYNDFLDRTVPELSRMVKDDKLHIAMTHNRVMTLIRALAKNKGEYPETSILKREAPVEPSGFMILDSDWRIVFAYLPEDLTEHGDKD